MDNNLRTQKEERMDRGLNGEKRSRELMENTSELLTKVRGISGNAMKQSIAFAKRYPVSTALGAAAVGFFTGFLCRRK